MSDIDVRCQGKRRLKYRLASSSLRDLKQPNRALVRVAYSYSSKRVFASFIWAVLKPLWISRKPERRGRGFPWYCPGTATGGLGRWRRGVPKIWQIAAARADTSSGKIRFQAPCIVPDRRWTSTSFVIFLKVRVAI